MKKIVVLVLSLLIGGCVGLPAYATGTTTSAGSPFGGSVVITSGSTASSGCTAGGVFFSGSNLMVCNDTDLVFDGTTLTAKGLIVTNAPTFTALTATRVPFAGTAGLLGDAASLTFNSGTGALAATTFVGALTGNVTGNLTGNVTGNASGTAATVTGAAQTAITSVGTLGGLTVTAAPTFSAMTSGRVHYSGTAGLLTDSANLLFSATGSPGTGPMFTVGSGATTSAGMSIGEVSSNLAAIWLTGSGAPTTTNYFISGLDAGGGGATTMAINSAGSPVLAWRVSGVTKFSINNSTTDTYFDGAAASSIVHFRVDGNNDKLTLYGTAGRGPDITAGTATTDVNGLSLTHTLNGAVVFSTIKSNVTVTSQTAGSLHLNLQRSGTTQFGVTNGAASTGTQVRTAQATAPTCSSNCGTSPSVAGSDTAMTVTMGGTGSPTSGFVITFNGTWATAPACTGAPALAGMVVGKLPIVIATTTTTITVTTNGTAPATSDMYHFHCIGIS